ncbi:MAG: FtsW/RodA/SpoVE family cell cycle protein, partial [Clostridia bacterium]|nr:FtsW/RodA/SpoVE family cell cycle protein [Clostridia bacterium]
IIGIACMVLVMMIDYKDFKFLSIPAYAGTVLLLVVVLFLGKGREEVGTNGWLLLGPASFQPSELGKVTLAVVTAVFFERIKQGNGGINYIWLIASAGGLIGLILLQPDFGTAVVYMFMLALMVFVFGIRYKVLLIGLASTLVALPVLWFGIFEKILKPYQLERILSFLNKSAFERTAAYQVLMSIRYIGSGTLRGVEPAAQKAAINVPASATDSIFAVIGEEWGFIGTVAVVLLFVALVLRCLYISRFAKDKYGAYIVIGLMGMFLFHFVENVGMNIGMLPVTGIPLPFISYGGSSLVVNYLAIGVIISISMRRQRPMFEV